MKKNYLEAGLRRCYLISSQRATCFRQFLDKNYQIPVIGEAYYTHIQIECLLNGATNLTSGLSDFSSVDVKVLRMFTD